MVESHKLMISAGHPPLAPIEKDYLAVDEDKWGHLRHPPLILKRELIENWNEINVVLPKDRDKDELTQKEREQQAIEQNAKEQDMRKKYELI